MKPRTNQLVIDRHLPVSGVLLARLAYSTFVDLQNEHNKFNMKVQVDIEMKVLSGAFLVGEVASAACDRAGLSESSSLSRWKSFLPAPASQVV